MIDCQPKPCAVFEAILKEAVTSEALEIPLPSDDGAIDSWEGFYPQSSQRLTLSTTVSVLAQFLAAVNETQVYRLTDLHGLGLYESLKNFCAIHNDWLGVQHTRPIGEDRIAGKWMDGPSLALIVRTRTFSFVIEGKRGTKRTPGSLPRGVEGKDAVGTRGSYSGLGTGHGTRVREPNEYDLPCSIRCPDERSKEGRESIKMVNPP